MNRIPKLRFPEFSGDWESSDLENVFKVLKNNSYTRDDLNYESGTIKNIHYGDIHTKFPTIIDSKRAHIPFINDDIDLSRISQEDYCLDGDILIADASENYADIGKTVEISNINDLKVIAGLHVILARDTNKHLANNFRGYLMNSPSIHEQVRILATGSKVIGINKEMIKSVRLAYPSIPEQQKIADFLSTIDSQVETKEKEIENLEEMKKGFMQKIFSQELRFKDENGKDYPEWEEEKLGELCNITTGKLDANAMVEGGQYRFYTCAREYYFINDYKFDTEALLISGNGANVGYIHYYNGKFNAYQRTYVLDNFKNDIIYIKYYLEQNLSIRISREKKDGNTPYIVLSTLSDMDIRIPSLSEQKKIANFLSLFDGKIEIEKEILETLRELKKGLLQQMFV